MAVSPYLLIITLYVKGLNSPIKRHAVDEWIKKQDPEICCLQQTHFNFMEIQWLKVKGYKHTVYTMETKRKLRKVYLS